MASAWFSNRGQMIQVLIALAACIFGGVKAWQDMKNSALLAPGPLLFYLLVALVVAFLINSGRRKANEDSARVEPLIVVESHPSVEPNATYKRKIRVVLRNESGQSVYVQKPRWITGPGDVAIQVPFGSTFELERMWNRKLGPWEDETSDAIYIHPRQRVKTWIGLDPNLTGEQMEDRHRGRRLGTLALPVRVAQHEIEQKIRL